MELEKRVACKLLASRGVYILVAVEWPTQQLLNNKKVKLFSGLNLLYLVLNVREDISSAQSMAISCGFRESGIFESSELTVDGGAKQDLMIFQGYQEIPLPMYLFPR
ncbi:hypothetical protein MKW98_011846 [Papaver atlanticum]|uniref:Uncharacterized protein n=1 Tax=Papaver atlanticum TaxID=357466 RepID=A0AAD4SM08_9MAGN|nr:hypothetical protein MKW98_011846 [Papaver atlanticum]